MLIIHRPITEDRHFPEPDFSGASEISGILILRSRPIQEETMHTLASPKGPRCTFSQKWCCVRSAHESIVFNRLDLALSEKQILRFVVKVSS